MTIETSAGISHLVPEELVSEGAGEPERGPRSNRLARRTFSAEFKRAIVQEYDMAPNGSKGAVLRRERLYDSHIQEWRAAMEAGTLDKPSAGTRRGRPKNTTEQVRIAQLTKELATERTAHEKTREQLVSSEAALDTLGKGVAFLEALSSKNASSPMPPTSCGKHKP